MLLLNCFIFHCDVHKRGKSQQHGRQLDSRRSAQSSGEDVCVLPYSWLSLSLSVIIIKVNCGSRAPDEEYNISISKCAWPLPSLPSQLRTGITTLSQHIAHTLDHPSECPHHSPVSLPFSLALVYSYAYIFLLGAIRSVAICDKMTYRTLSELARNHFWCCDIH